MRKGLLLALLILLLAACACRAAALPVVSPEAAGLSWRECPVTGYNAEEAAACLGHPYGEQTATDRAAMGTRQDDTLRLRIGADAYEARSLPTGLFYLLSRNGRPVSILPGRYETHDPSISVRNVAGQVAWEFSDDGWTSTIIYGGRDLRRVYGIDAAYRPYELAGKLIFTAQRGGRYFIIYDGRQIGPTFDHIMIAQCCEAVLYSPVGGGGEYRFWGERDGRMVVVEVAPAPASGFALYLTAGTLSPAETVTADVDTLALQGEPILSSPDIVSYARETHEITLTPAAAERIRGLRVPTRGVSFVACVDGEPIYAGAFWTALSSQSFDGIVIETVPPSPDDTIRLQLCYPESPEMFQGQDLRAAPRILRALEQAGKLR